MGNDEAKTEHKVSDEEKLTYLYILQNILQTESKQKTTI